MFLALIDVGAWSVTGFYTILVLGQLNDTLLLQLMYYSEQSVMDVEGILIPFTAISLT